ncbi:hypothetical protein KBC04_05615 [Candidatus Babeliales bacterium]|nr:hypothetical protein [Candidatus Babeliales bacterium]MBP9843840.1 hypothetical protein [Candidatus Babeliales bacterium]
MNIKLFGLWVLVFFTSMQLVCEQEFIVSKKTKTKKEIALHVKEDIAELYESILRQLGSNIQQAVVVQNQVIDKIKNFVDDSSQSTHQLKELRDKLEKYLKTLEEQQADLQNFLLFCK